MAEPEKREKDQKPRNKEKWLLAAGFKKSWQKFKTDALCEAMATFDRCKRAIPPEPLPAKMKDHNLKGPLKGFSECHLDDDALLIYKPAPKGAIKLFRVCTHDDLDGPKAKVLAKVLKSE